MKGQKKADGKPTKEKTLSKRDKQNRTPTKPREDRDYLYVGDYRRPKPSEQKRKSDRDWEIEPDRGRERGGRERDRNRDHDRERSRRRDGSDYDHDYSDPDPRARYDDRKRRDREPRDRRERCDRRDRRDHHDRREYRERPPPRRRRDPEEPTRAPFNAGTYLAIVALLIVLISAFLPWYAVKVNIKSGVYNTDGDFELISINGWEGFKINQPPKDGEEQDPFFSMQNFTGGIPVLGIIFILIVIIGLLRIFFIKDSKKRGKKTIKTGISCLIPIIIILLVIGFLPNITQNFSPPEPIEKVIDTMSSNPLGGSQTVITSEWANASVNWGVQVGGWLLLASSILIIIGGIIDWSKKRPEDIEDEDPRSRSDYDDRYYNDRRRNDHYDDHYDDRNDW